MTQNAIPRETRPALIGEEIRAVRVVMAMNLEPGMTVWHHDELRTVAEVFHPTMVLKDRAFVLWNDGLRDLVRQEATFVIFSTPAAPTHEHEPFTIQSGAVKCWTCDETLTGGA